MLVLLADKTEIMQEKIVIECLFELFSKFRLVAARKFKS
jgi:hypothetical protein